MTELEQIFNDEMAWVCYEGHEENETVGVYRRCPECGRYLKEGELLANLDGEIEVRGWICKKHGEVEPYFDRWDDN